MSLVHLDRGGVCITDQRVTSPGGAWGLGQVQQAWVEERRPGLAIGALMAVLGAAMLSRGAGPAKLLGLVLLVLGVLRARTTDHVLVLRLRDGSQPAALRTRDPTWAREVLAALDRARGAALPAGKT